MMRENLILDKSKAFALYWLELLYESGYINKESFDRQFEQG